MAPDVRALALGAGAWVGALLVLLLPGPWAVAAVAVLAAGTGILAARGRVPVGWLAPVAALVAVAGVAGLQSAALASSPVADLARQRAVVTVRLEVTSDVRVVQGRFGDLQVARARVLAVEGRGSAWRLDAPVVLMADADWPSVPLGTTLDTTARLAPADDGAVALLRPVGEPRAVRDPDVWWDAAAAVRHAVRAAVAGRDRDARELVPALVVGDDGGLAPALADDFRTTGLTHLLAVSGTNLTLVVGALLVLGRGSGCADAGSTSSPRSASPGSCSPPAPSRASCARPRWVASPSSGWGTTAARGAYAGSGSPCSGCCSYGHGSP